MMSWLSVAGDAPGVTALGYAYCIFVLWVVGTWKLSRLNFCSSTVIPLKQEHPDIPIF
jgi:hypothetical protein